MQSRSRTPSPSQAALSKYPKFVVPISDNSAVRLRARVELKSRVEPRYDPTMHIEWFKDDVPIRSTNRVHVYFDRGYAALVISGYEQRDDGHYTCVATNSSGSAKVQARLQLDARYALKKQEDAMKEEKIKRLLRLKETMKKADEAEAERRAQYAARIKAQEEAEAEAIRQAERARRDARAEWAKQQARARIEASEKAARERALQARARQYQIGLYGSGRRGDAQQAESRVRLGPDGQALLWSPYRTVEDTKLLTKERTIYETIIEYEPMEKDKDLAASGTDVGESVRPSSVTSGHSLMDSFGGQQLGYQRSSSSALGNKLSEITDWRARALAAYEAMSESERKRTGWAKYGYASGQNKLLAEALARTQIKPYREVDDTIILRKEVTIFETIKEFEPVSSATGQEETDGQAKDRKKVSDEEAIVVQTRSGQIEDAINKAANSVVVSDFTVGQSNASDAVQSATSASISANLTNSSEVDDYADVSPAAGIWIPYRTVEDTVLFKKERTIYETIIEYEPSEEKPVIEHKNKGGSFPVKRDARETVVQRPALEGVSCKMLNVVPEKALEPTDTKRLTSRLRGGESAQVSRVELQPSRIPRIIYNKPESQATTSSQDDSSKQAIGEQENRSPTSSRMSRIDSALLSKYPRFAIPLEDNLKVRERSRVELRSRLIPRDDATMKIEWFKDDIPIASSDRVCTYYNRGYAALIIHDFDESDNGVYRCVASNCCGTDRTEAKLLIGRPASREGTSLEHRRQLERIRAEARRVEREIAAKRAEAAARIERKAKQEAEARRETERMRREARLERERILAEASLRSRENSKSPMRFSSLRRSVSSDTGRFLTSPVSRASSVNENMELVLSRSLSRSEQRARECGLVPDLPVAARAPKSRNAEQKVEGPPERIVPEARRLRGGEVRFGELVESESKDTEPNKEEIVDLTANVRQQSTGKQVSSSIEFEYLFFVMRRA